jgi:acyl-CoA reductase-like NAD-dependent aldehyde dehydrogenase
LGCYFVRLKVDNPYTGETFCEVAYDSKAEAHAKLDAAVKAQLDWKNVPLSERQALCSKWIDALSSNVESIAHEISGMMGKPVQQAHNEVNGTIDRAKYERSSCSATTTGISSHVIRVGADKMCFGTL